MRVKMIDEETQPWRDFGLLFVDLCLFLWLVPSMMQAWGPRVRKAHRYRPRHSLQAMISIPPNFMRTWHLL